jgi:MFS family permease
MPLLSFLRAHGTFVGFGALMCFLSSAGQTYFISLFGGEIRQAFELSHGGFGSVYAVGTLGSAAILVWAGRIVDHAPLPAVAAAVVSLLALACMLMGGAWGIVSLTAAVFGLRLFGQGLAVHTAITAMARYFEVARGRAISIASLGNPAGAALAPIFVVAMLPAIGWRAVWVVTGVGLLCAIPLVLLLLRGHGARHRALVERLERDPRPVDGGTLRFVLRDPGLWFRLPALLAHSFISTGLIFHQVHLANAKGWPLSLLAASFSAYAAASVLALMTAGPLVDRFSAVRIMPLFLLPLTLSCTVLVASDAAWTAPVFLALLGISTGLTAVVKGALWAELYGVTNLGAIRAFGQSAMVFSTGLAPAAMGLPIDLGISIASIATASAVYCVAASFLAGAVPVRRRVRC